MPRGSLRKVDIQARVLKIQHQLKENVFHPEWDDIQKDSANVILNHVLDIINEYYN